MKYKNSEEKWFVADKHPSLQILRYVDLIKKNNSEVKFECDNKRLKLIPVVYMLKLPNNYPDAPEGKTKNQINYEKALEGYTPDEDEIKRAQAKVTVCYKDKRKVRDVITKNINKGSRKPLQILAKGMPAVNTCLWEKASMINNISHEEYFYDEQKLKNYFMLEDKSKLVLRWDQKKALEKLIECFDSYMECKDKSKWEKKRVLVTGGPGSGKTVIALLFKNYCEKVYLKSYKGTLNNEDEAKKKARRDVWYGYPIKSMNEKYGDRKPNKNTDDIGGYLFSYPKSKPKVVIYDEANRNLNEVDPKGFEAAALIVFFADGLQAVDKKRDGSVKDKFEKMEDESLVSQFRCNGDEGYIRF